MKAPLVKVPKGIVKTMVQFLLRNRLFLKNLLKHRLAKKSLKNKFVQIFFSGKKCATMSWMVTAYNILNV